MIIGWTIPSFQLNLTITLQIWVTIIWFKVVRLLVAVPGLKHIDSETYPAWVTHLRMMKAGFSRVSVSSITCVCVCVSGSCQQRAVINSCWLWGTSSRYSEVKRVEMWDLWKLLSLWSVPLLHVTNSSAQWEGCDNEEISNTHTLKAPRGSLISEPDSQTGCVWTRGGESSESSPFLLSGKRGKSTTVIKSHQIVGFPLRKAD